MKINRFIAMAVIALLVVGAMGALSARSFAQTTQPQTQATEAPESNTQEDNQVNEQETAPVGTPAISAEAAQKTAEAYLNAGPATEVELDNENGKLVYSVEFNGTDVKVDAMTGEVLTTATDQD